MRSTGTQVPSAINNTPPVGAFGQYVLMHKLAEGGMAEIFRAKQTGAQGFERDVVIKRMLSHLSSMPDFVTMFLDEARIAARLSHPNIVQIYDLGLAEGYYYICMEYLAGEDLSAVLRKASERREYVPLPIVVRVLIDAAQGLHFAHEFADDSGQPLNIVHRDISPSNLYVTYQGQVKVLDFGIAKAESRNTQTKTGVVKGKYIYMAPEQARGLPVDRRSDVFSLGVSLYEALTHRRPFARDNDLAVLSAVLQGDFQPPRALRPELPQELESIVLKAMSLKPEDRHATAAEFAASLERFLGASASNTTVAHVSHYLRGSFGEQRYSEKTRIPTLASLAAAGVVVPGYGHPEPHSDAPVTAPGTGGNQEKGTSVLASGKAKRLARRKRLWTWAGGLVGGAVLAWAALFFWLQPGASERVPERVVSPVPPPVTPTTVVPTAPVLPTPEPPLPEPTAVKPPRTVRPTGPVSLGVGDIQRVVSRGRSGIMPCFEKFKDDLPEDAGQVRVQFTIFGTGKVEAATQGPLATSRVGQCLEKQVARLHFPAHKDEKVTVELPFEYRVTR